MTPDEATSKALFFRLQPSCTPLLEAVSRYQTLVSRVTFETAIQDLLAVINLQNNLTTRLEHELSSLSVYHDISEEEVSSSLSVLLGYILLPTLAIIKGTQLVWNQESGSCFRNPLLMSASFKLVRTASSLLVTILRLIKSIPIKESLNCLVACCSALPSEEYMVKDYREVHTLDRGDTTVSALIETLKELLARTNANDIMEVMSTPMGMNLVARLAQSMLSIITPSDLGKPPPVSLQIQSVDTLRGLFLALRDAKYWVPLFPGTFSALYQCFQRSLKMAQRSLRVAVSSFETLIDFLEICLVQDVSDEEDPETKKNIMLCRLRTLASTKSGPGVEIGEEPGERWGIVEEQNEFVTRIDKFVGPPLAILLRMAGRANAVSIRGACPRLCVLVLSRRSYFQESGNEIVISALESLFILTQDVESSVRSSATTCLTSPAVVASKHSVKRVVAIRIERLLNEISVLVESNRTAELLGTLQLTCGYFDCFFWTKAERKSLVSFISSEAMMSLVVTSLSKVLDMPTVPDESPLSFDDLTSIGTNLTRKSVTILDADVRKACEEVLRNLSSLLGSRRTVMLIERHLSELQSECSSRLEKGRSESGLGQAVWVSSWLGRAKVMRYLLAGLVKTKSNGKQKLTRHLVTSTLPLIISDPVWGLPVEHTVSFADASMSSKVDTQSTKNQSESPAGLNANADLAVILLDMVGEISSALESEAAIDLLTTALLPIIEKQGSGNEIVARGAVDCLCLLATASRCTNVESLVRRNVGLVVNALSLQVRIPSLSLPGRATFENHKLRSAQTFSVVLQMCSVAFDGLSDKGVLSDPGFMAIEELMREMIAVYDRSGARIQRDLNTSMVFLNLFQCFASYLEKLYSSRELWQQGNATSPEVQPWTELLEPFRLSPLSPAEGFQAYWERKAENETRKSHPDGTEILPPLVLQRDTEFVSLLIARSCYLLSHPNLTIQIESCNVLTRCFMFLSLISNVPKDENDEDSGNGPQTAILRQIHSAWPALSMRLQNVCTSLQDSVASQTYLVLQPTQSTTGTFQQSPKYGEQRVLVSKLLELIASMTEAADDFMARRFRDVIWPCISTLMSTLFLGTTSSRFKPSFFPSEVDLLCSIFECCRRVFAHRDTGHALWGLIPTAGTIFLPFLGRKESRIANSCLSLFRSMIDIDSDALLRPLYQLAGKSWGRCPLSSDADDFPDSANMPTTLPAVAAQSLIEYIDQLPEQPLRE